MSDVTLWKNVQNWAQNNRIIVGFLAIAAVVILLANFTNAIETLIGAYGRWTGGADFADRQACLDAATNFREVSQCYRAFP